jgi:hypothetical protein
VAIFAGFIEFGKKAETCARQSQGEAAQLSGQYRLIYVGAKRAQRKRLAQNLWLSQKNRCATGTPPSPSALIIKRSWTRTPEK